MLSVEVGKTGGIWDSWYITPIAACHKPWFYPLDMAVPKSDHIYSLVGKSLLPLFALVAYEL